MAILISDDGQVQNWLDDNGQQIQVASQFAPLGLAPADPLAGVGTPTVPPPAAIAPVEVPAAQPDPALAGPGAAIQPPPGPPAPGPAEVAPAPAPAIPAAPVAPSPTEEQVLEMPLNEADVFASPSILPTGPLDKPTQVADAINETAQARADSARRVGQEQVAAGQDIVNSGLDADIRLQEYEKQRAAELQQRQADEAVLGEKHQKLVNSYANFKIDPNRGMSSDRQAMAWIGAALAGLGQVIAGKDPSQNPVIPMIFAQMDRRVQLQMAERDALGQSIGQSKDGLADFRGVTKTRLGEYDLRMGSELERHAKLVDRVKVRLGSIEQQEAATQLAQSLRAESVARTGSATKAEADQRAAERRAAAAAMAARAKAAEEQRRWEANEKVRFNPQTGRYEPDPTMQDPKDALALEGVALDNAKKRRDLDNPAVTEGSVARVKDDAARSLNGFDGKPLYRSVVQKDAQGNDVVVAVQAKAKTEREGEELRDMGSKYDVINRAIDLLAIAIENNGGSSETLGGPEYQEATSLLSTVTLEAKDLYKLGVIAGPDEKLIAGAHGGVDPRSFVKNGTAGLRAMQSRMKEKYDAALRQKSDYYDSKDAKPVEPTKSAAAKVSEQAPHERVADFTRGNPTLKKDDKTKVAEDAEIRLDAVKTFLKRDKPSPEAIDAAIRQANADTYMPASTKAQVLATLREALNKANEPGVKQLRDIGRTVDPNNSVPILENLELGLPTESGFRLPRKGGS